MERAKRTLNLARNQLGYSDLKADADGVVTSVLAESGQVVALGQPVARIARNGEKEAVVALPETWLGGARKSNASVRLWSDRGRNLKATLRANCRRRPMLQHAPMRPGTRSSMLTTASRSE